jgi:hypothetical protein
MNATRKQSFCLKQTHEIMDSMLLLAYKLEVNARIYEQSNTTWTTLQSQQNFPNPLCHLDLRTGPSHFSNPLTNHEARYPSQGRIFLHRIIIKRKRQHPNIIITLAGTCHFTSLHCLMTNIRHQCQHTTPTPLPKIRSKIPYLQILASTHVNPKPSRHSRTHVIIPLSSKQTLASPPSTSIFT